MSTYFNPSRLVVVGVNVDHNELVKLTEKHFVDQDTSWSDVSPSEPDNTPAIYTGGMAKVKPPHLHNGSVCYGIVYYALINVSL